MIRMGLSFLSWLVGIFGEIWLEMFILGLIGDFCVAGFVWIGGVIEFLGENKVLIFMVWWA